MQKKKSKHCPKKSVINPKIECEGLLSQTYEHDLKTKNELTKNLTWSKIKLYSFNALLYFFLMLLWTIIIIGTPIVYGVGFLIAISKLLLKSIETNLRNNKKLAKKIARSRIY